MYHNGASSGYRTGYLEGAEAVLRQVFDCWPPAERDWTWRQAYRRCATYVQRLAEWAKGQASDRPPGLKVGDRGRELDGLELQGLEEEIDQLTCKRG